MKNCYMFKMTEKDICIQEWYKNYKYVHAMKKVVKMYSGYKKSAVNNIHATKEVM